MTHPRSVAALLLAGSTLLTSAPALANAGRILSLSAGQSTSGPLVPGERVTTDATATQVMIRDGGILSFVGEGSFTLTETGDVVIHSGNATVLASARPLNVTLPNGTQATLPLGSSSSFTSIGTQMNGHILTGRMTLSSGSDARTFSAGQAWQAGNGQKPDLVVANSAQIVPPVASQKQGGLAAAATNGQPIGLGQALAAIGAAGDVVAAATRLQASAVNPSLATIPASDATLLLDYADRLAQLYGASTFNGAGADLVRAYLQYVGQGGTPADFQTAYSDLVTRYIDLLRSGNFPAEFDGVSQAAINAYLGYIRSIGALDALPAENRAFIAAYLEDLASGGTGAGFLQSYADAINAYIAYLKDGGLPSAYTALNADQIAQYLELLKSGGLLETLLGGQLSFVTDYLAFLQGGGSPDQFTGFPIPNLPGTVDPATPGTPQIGNGMERSGQFIAYAGSEIGIDQRDKVITRTTVDGTLNGYSWTVNTDESPARGTNASFEAGTAGGVIGWSRWADGSTDGRYFVSPPSKRSSKQGLHLVYGTPATDIPTSGTVSYSLVGSTKPTIRDGSVDPGSFSGSAAVAFGSTAKVGLDMQVSIGGHNYAVTTAGGVTSPSSSQLSVGANMGFRSNIDVAPGGPACAANSCSAIVTGFLAGPGASHLGFSYTIGGSAFDKQVDGAAVFAR